MPRLRSHLLRWLLIPLFFLWIVAFRVSFLRSLDQANQAYDRTLLGSALAMAERVSVQDGEVIMDVPYAAFEMLETGSQDRIFYRVSCLDPKLPVTGYDDLPVPQRFPKPDRPVFYEAKYRGEAIRLVALLRPVYDARVAGPILVQVGETMGARQLLSRRILVDSALTQLALIVVAAILIAFGVGRGLEPLLRLRREIRERDVSDLTPIDTQGVPREVVPLIEAINTHTERQKQLNDIHRQFIADASHQLRTPLTVLKTQSALALRQTDAAAVRAIVQQIHDSTDATSRVIQQLLILARSEPGHTVATEPVDMTEVAREVTLELLSLAHAESIDLGFEADECEALIQGNPLLLHELVSNLVDNAIRYTQPGGSVTVRIRRGSGQVVLETEDNGPGIAEAERAKVFHRFYRVPGARSDGCGLGLAIVKGICDRHGASIRLGGCSSGRGLLVTIEFPVPDARGLSTG